MATGKTNRRYIKMFVEDSGATDRDVTCSLTQLNEFGLTYAEENMTAYCDGVENFTLGHPSSPITAEFNFDNTALVGSHTVLDSIAGDMSQTYTVTIQVGIRTAPTGGDPEFEGEYYLAQYTTDGVKSNARFVPGSGTAPDWGVVV